MTIEECDQYNQERAIKNLKELKDPENRERYSISYSLNTSDDFGGRNVNGK